MFRASLQCFQKIALLAPVELTCRKFGDIRDKTRSGFGSVSVMRKRIYNKAEKNEMKMRKKWERE